MNIVYASDNNFAEILGISMLSLFENNKECSEITLYILNDRINEDNVEKLRQIAEKYGRNLIFVDVDNIDVPLSVQSSRWSKSAFTRLYLKKLIPDAEKVLYLDCDILVNGSISELYNTDLNGFCAAGVCDCISDGYLKNLDMLPDGKYFNSGVLLINMNEWNSEDFMRFFDDHSAVIRYPDQDVINGTYVRKIKVLDLKWNCYTQIFDFKYNDLMTFRKPSSYYSENELTEAKNNPSIVHFTTSFLSLRPWIEGCEHPYAKEWLKYKAMTPWSDAPMREDNRSGKKKFAVRVYRLIPNKLAVNIAGLLHSKIVPALKGK